MALTTIVPPLGSVSLVNTSPVVPVDPSVAVTVASSFTELVLFVAEIGSTPPPTTVTTRLAVVVAVPSERV